MTALHFEHLDFLFPETPPALDQLADLNLTPLPTHPEIKCVASSPCCDKSEEKPGRFYPALLPASGLVSLLMSTEYIGSTLKEALSSTAGDRRSWGHLVPGLFPLLQLLSYVKGRGSWKTGLMLFLTQWTTYQDGCSLLSI